ncbi:MAG: PhzF family phenazine biosynthesis protein [Chloroflexales bacterium]|nr:PhzF family phenazine biosynthesis protein [Chloroflexales bacterium]
MTSRGIMVTSQGREYDFVSRFFAPAVGIDEDPVTGSAHCCLGPFWSQILGKNSLTALQASPRGGALAVIVDADRVRRVVGPGVEHAPVAEGRGPAVGAGLARGAVGGLTVGVAMGAVAAQGVDHDVWRRGGAVGGGAERVVVGPSGGVGVGVVVVDEPRVAVYLRVVAQPGVAHAPQPVPARVVLGVDKGEVDLADEQLDDRAEGDGPRGHWQLGAVEAVPEGAGAGAVGAPVDGAVGGVGEAAIAVSVDNDVVGHPGGGVELEVAAQRVGAGLAGGALLADEGGVAWHGREHGVGVEPGIAAGRRSLGGHGSVGAEQVKEDLMGDVAGGRIVGQARVVQPVAGRQLLGRVIADELDRPVDRAALLGLAVDALGVAEEDEAERVEPVHIYLIAVAVAREDVEVGVEADISGRSVDAGVAAHIKGQVVGEHAAPHLDVAQAAVGGVGVAHAHIPGVSPVGGEVIRAARDGPLLVHTDRLRVLADIGGVRADEVELPDAAGADGRRLGGADHAGDEAACLGQRAGQLLGAVDDAPVEGLVRAGGRAEGAALGVGRRRPGAGGVIRRADDHIAL